MLLVLSGLPATGKSLLARALGRSLGLPVLSVDPIESAMLRAGLAQGFATGLAAYLVVETIADAALGLGQGAIVDAVNCVDEAKAMWRALADRHRVPLKVIECHCSDEPLHRQRLESRQRGLDPAFPEPTWEDVARRRATYTAWSEPLLAVDAVAPLEANLERALAWLAPDAAPPVLDHLSLGVADLARALPFYDAALAPLGHRRLWTRPDGAGYGGRGTDEKLALAQRPSATPAGPGFHLALTAVTRRAVDAFFAAALRAGGRDDGPPGLRPHYGPDYYAAFVIDPDGHRLEAVCHRPA